ncbi:MAG: hypothetical protein M1831_004842 [Alyxoria varia]|nr:MAG: hypothetical protein M1831_004842 [Alyxoria varia]
MALEAAPSSPPELSSSKSSTKSSSLHSSSLPNGEELTDFSHFEDISLSADTQRNGPSEENKRTSKSRSLLQNSRTNSSTEASRSTTTLSDHRSPSKPRPRLHGHARSINEQSVARNKRARPLLKSPTSLAIPQHKSGQQPSSPVASPKLPVSPFAPTPRTASSPVLPIPRRGSAQAPRKTAKELEQEFHDSDDELPEDAVIMNVPLSPRPPEARSHTPSPERTPTLDSRPESDGYNFTRTKSYDAAISDLSTETRDLTNKLETHYDLTQRNSYDATGAKSPSPPLSIAYRRAQTWATPPIQKGDAMIDPLPISKEKERHLTRTRPAWLPPKSKKEEKRHLKQYRQMIDSFMESEKRRSAETSVQKQDQSEALKSWRNVLSQWDVMTQAPQTRNLWWSGIPAALRGQVWARAIGNELHLSAGSYSAALARARAIEERLSSSKSSTSAMHTHARHSSASETKADSRARRSLASITHDITTGVFPSLNLFQPGQPRHDELKDLLLAYAAYREDTGHVQGTAGIAALLLLNYPIMPEQNESTIATSGDHPTQQCDESSAAAFISFANLLNRPVNLSFCLNDQNGKNKVYKNIMRATKHKQPKLHEHLMSLHLSLNDLLGPLCQSLATSHLSPEDAARIWDVLVFEGDGVVVRSAVGILGKLESKLYGQTDEIKAVLGWSGHELAGQINKRDSVDMGGEESTVQWLRWAGREDAVAPS